MVISWVASKLLRPNMAHSAKPVSLLVTWLLATSGCGTQVLVVTGDVRAWHAQHKHSQEEASEKTHEKTTYWYVLQVQAYNHFRCVVLSYSAYSKYSRTYRPGKPSRVKPHYCTLPQPGGPRTRVVVPGLKLALTSLRMVLLSISGLCISLSINGRHSKHLPRDANSSPTVGSSALPLVLWTWNPSPLTRISQPKPSS